MLKLVTLYSFIALFSLSQAHAQKNKSTLNECRDLLKNQSLELVHDEQELMGYADEVLDWLGSNKLARSNDSVVVSLHMPAGEISLTESNQWISSLERLGLYVQKKTASFFPAGDNVSFSFFVVGKFKTLKDALDQRLLPQTSHLNVLSLPTSVDLSKLIVEEDQDMVLIDVTENFYPNLNDVVSDRGISKTVAIRVRGKGVLMAVPREVIEILAQASQLDVPGYMEKKHSADLIVRHSTETLNKQEWTAVIEGLNSGASYLKLTNHIALSLNSFEAIEREISRLTRDHGFDGFVEVAPDLMGFLRSCAACKEPDAPSSAVGSETKKPAPVTKPKPDEANESAPIKTGLNKPEIETPKPTASTSTKAAPQSKPQGTPAADIIDDEPLVINPLPKVDRSPSDDLVDVIEFGRLPIADMDYLASVYPNISGMGVRYIRFSQGVIDQLEELGSIDAEKVARLFSQMRNGLVMGKSTSGFKSVKRTRSSFLVVNMADSKMRIFTCLKENFLEVHELLLDKNPSPQVLKAAAKRVCD